MPLLLTQQNPRTTSVLDSAPLKAVLAMPTTGGGGGLGLGPHIGEPRTPDGQLKTARHSHPRQRFPATQAADPGSRYFCESFYGPPSPTSGKSYATAYACGCPSRPASFVGYPARGIQHLSRNDSTRCRESLHFHYAKSAS
jgi:hypothetical protein